MNPLLEYNTQVSRRQFFRQGGTGLGMAALASLLPSEALSLGGRQEFDFQAIAPKAKRAIFLSMVGGPAQMEMWDPKPHLRDQFKKDLTGYLKSQGQRLTGMTAGQSSFPLAPSAFDFSQHGKSGMWVSELLPHTAKVVDDICLIRSMHTEAINHEPANQLCYTGNQVAGKASLGSWLSYGLGSSNENLPSFVVLHAKHSNPAANVQAISNRLWGSGYLPGKFAGVELRSVGDPVLYLRDAPGIDRATRRQMLDGLTALNQESLQLVGDPNIQTRIQQYEMAFRMQASVPELTDLSSEPESSFDLYGEDSRKAGTFASSALMGRRLLERGVKFVQVFHRGWDQHGSLPQHLPDQCRDIDQGCAALITDLKRRGMLEDTLVIWGGEFGRTIYSQGKLTNETYGRDHHPRAFSVWMAGGGIKGGLTHGTTDEYGYNIVENPVHIRDLHATILHQLGLNHETMTYKYQGLDQRLTGVEHAHVLKDILA
ncbi:DUF1501 domain-containing protein [Roseibacillus ishigakijimensis]|uniref:DUF1501 domain-containing protein n=1 Tax=Roseibacillus ishigakijimensis TaxID=454146 RepID=A0A934RNP0_9BACT|nr:DUF1501 domain-containing protein [Roseibacillus ishigakijimensis]MBK1832992.1 DUF1501 domain-containing protein [Roseibacillus ishigakijimensis]